jgi:hypothetical protein
MKIDNSFIFCAPRATMPKKRASAMNMAANTAKSVAAKASKSNKKKERNPPSSDEEDELERAPKKSTGRDADASSVEASVQDASSNCDDDDMPLIPQKRTKLSQEDDTVESEPKLPKTKTKHAD